MTENKKKLIIGLIVLLIAGPVLTGHYAGWSWAFVKYPLYIDAGILAVLSLFYFQKYLIDENGKLLEVFESSVNPMGPEIVGFLEG